MLQNFHQTQPTMESLQKQFTTSVIMVIWAILPLYKVVLENKDTFTDKQSVLGLLVTSLR